MKQDSSTVAWNRIGKEYCEFTQTDNYRNDFRRYFIMPYTLGKLKNAAAGKIILDLGCGDGGYSRALARAGAAVTSVDCAADSVQFASEKANEEGLRIQHFIRNSCDLYGIEDNTFDLVLCSMMLMDCEDLDGTVSEIERVLKPGGTVFISILHPCFNGGNIRWSKNADGETTEVIVKDYFSPREWEKKLGETYSFPVIWRHRTLEDYFKTFHRHHLNVIDLNEPLPTSEQLQKSDRVKWLTKIPMFLFIELQKNR